MYKYYPAIIIDREDVNTICNEPVAFEQNETISMSVYEKLENYFCQPIVQIHTSAKNENQLILIVANGSIHLNPITKKKLVLLDAPIEDLKIILQDIFNEHPDVTPADLYEKYSFKCPVHDQFVLHEWFKKNYSEN